MNLLYIAQLLQNALVSGDEKRRALEYLADLLELGVCFEEIMVRVSLEEGPSKILALEAVLACERVRRKYRKFDTLVEVN